MRRFVITGAAFGVFLLAGAAVAIASGWSIEHTPNPTGRSDSKLFGVSCVSASDCTAVGYYFAGAYATVALIERWNGTKWSIEHTPNTGRAGELLGVSCVSARDCTAVGSYSKGALAERWNGSDWSVEPTPNPSGESGDLSSVSCVSASDCTAVGTRASRDGNDSPLAEGWNGTEWSIEHTPNRGSGLDGVSCVSASACTAVGDYSFHDTAVGTLAERWNGSEWSIEHTPNPTGGPRANIFLSGVSCVSASACTAVGDGAEGGATLAERWNGSKWSIEHTSKLLSPQFVSVSCVSARDCTAVGSYFPSPTTEAGLAERWNGSEWSIEATSNAASQLFGVSCASARACTAVGTYYYGSHGIDNGTLAERGRG